MIGDLLNPCPNCGGTAWLEGTFDHDKNDFAYFAECMVCNTWTGLLPEDDDAIAAWNAGKVEQINHG